MHVFASHVGTYEEERDALGIPQRLALWRAPYSIDKKEDCCYERPGY